MIFCFFYVVFKFSCYIAFDNKVLSIITNFHEIGQDVSPNGQNTFFIAIADTTNIYGQAVIASLREGRNIEALNTAGIELDTQIPIDL